MEQDHGFGFGIRGILEVVNISIWAEAANDFGTRGGGNEMALGADGDFAIIADADIGLLAPDERPPRARWDGT